MKPITLTTQSRILKAAKDVPDPIDRIWCNSCPLDWPKLTTEQTPHGRRDYFKHGPTCWYGELRRAIAAAEKEIT